MKILHVIPLVAVVALCVDPRALQAQQAEPQAQVGYASLNEYPPPIASQPAPVTFGTTVDGEARAGSADQLQALGELRYNTALARRQNEEARRQAADNALYAERIYFEMHKLNQQYWLAQDPPLTPEQRVRINQSQLPRRLSPSELDPAWGTIYWPAMLQRPEFDQDRTKLNDIFAHRRDEQFGLGTPVYHQVQQLTKDMRDVLNKEYATMSQMEWIHAIRFVESLGYEARFSSSDTAAAPAVAMNR